MTSNINLVHYLDSMVNLDALDRMTNDLHSELKDSQKIMNEIKGMIDSIPSKSQEPIDPGDAALRHEELSNFVTSPSPKLLLPDMEEIPCDVDLNDIITSMRSYTEDLKNVIVKESAEPEVKAVKSTEPLTLEQYATSLDALSKRLSNLKLNVKEEASNLNTELESKLSLLCDDVKMFTQMIQTKAKVGELNKDWKPMEQDNEAMNYDSMINKLLSGINDVMYLMHRKN